MVYSGFRTFSRGFYKSLEFKAAGGSKLMMVQQLKLNRLGLLGPVFRVENPMGINMEDGMDTGIIFIVLCDYAIYAMKIIPKETTV